MDSVTNLDDADGETLENIIELLGMTEQLTRQLVMGANQVFLDILIEEKHTMTNFEQHIGQALPQAILAHLNDSPIDMLDKQARKLEFDSWCPVSMEGDSPELRKELKEASELLFKWIDFQSVTK